MQTIDPGTVALLGPVTATAAQAKAYARARGARRPEEVERFIDELWRLGEGAGYDPAVVFAQFCDETGTGTSPAWAGRLNPGGIGITDGFDAGIGFASGAEAARAMLVHLSAYVRGYDHAFWPFLALDPRYLEPLKRGWGGTVRRLGDLGNGKWATNPRYASQIAAHLANIRAAGRDDRGGPGAVAAPGGGSAAGAAAGARTGTDAGGATGPVRAVEPPPGIRWVGTPNWHPRPPGVGPEAVVFHVTDDLSAANVRSWFRDPASRASAHFVVDRDGAIEQFVPTAQASWTNGDVREPRLDLPWVARTVQRCAPFGPHNFNDFCVAIESVGKPGLPFPAAQIDQVVALTRYLLARYPAIRPTRGRLLRHADVNSVGRAYCPGPTFPLREIILAVGGDPDDVGG